MPPDPTAKNCRTLTQIREQMVQNWPEAVTPAGDLVTCIARLRDLLFANDRPAILDNGLATAEFDVLVTLRKMAPPHELTPTALGNSTLITSGGLTKVLHQLEEKLLVERINDPDDKRIKRVRLTASGISKAETALGDVLTTDTALLNQLITSDEQRELNTLLMKLLNGVEAQTHRP